VSGVLDGRMALVTGGSRGIGRAVVERLARDGSTVTFNYRSDHCAAEEVVASVTDAGGRATALQADLAEPGAGARLWDAAEALSGPVDILVNNAAVADVRTLAEVSDEDYERVMQVNLRTVFDTLREAVRRMPTAAGSSTYPPSIRSCPGRVSRCTPPAKVPSNSSR
jgi:3-oxoacyl-[acyl-carrier protein] reductase